MVTAQIVFPTSGSDWEAMVDAAISVLAIWYKNGQVATDEWPAIIDIKIGANLKFVVSLPEWDSLESRHNNEYSDKHLATLAEHGLAQPSIDVWGFDPGTLPACDCPRPQSYVLFTHYLTKEGPVRCGDCFHPVPLYRLKADNHGEYLYILHWRDNYRSCDTLQMNCSVGEAFGEEQLLEHDSQLSREGRKICRAIHEKSGAPAYYYLHKSRGKSLEEELQRRCPACGGSWMLEEKWHGKFNFKCDNCHLLSNVACSLDE